MRFLWFHSNSLSISSSKCYTVVTGEPFTGQLLKPGDIILFPDEYNSILIRTEINVPEIPKMNADNK